MKGERGNGGVVFYACFEDLTKEVAWTVHIREVVNNWVAMGRTVTLFCPSIFPFKYPPRSKVVYVPTVNVRIVGEYLYLLLLPFYIIFFGIKEKPKALYCREMSLMIFLFLASKIIRIPMLIEINGFLMEDLKIIGTSTIKLAIFNLLQRINFKLARALVFVSQELAEKYNETQKLRKEKTFVVPDGVDIDIFSPGDRVASIENLIEIGVSELNPKRRYVTFVGAFYPHSLATIIVKASKYVVKKCGDVDFLMIGGGHDFSDCRKIADKNRLTDRVTFLGVRPHSEIPNFIRASSILIYITADPKKWRNSMKTLEYMSSGGAVITNIKAIFHVPLTHGENFFYVDDATPEKLADAIIDLMENEKLREKIGRGARKLILENFSWRKTAESLLEIIDGL